MTQYINHRKANGISSYPAIATEMGITRDMLLKLRKGDRMLSHTVAEGMAKTTGLSPDYWLNLCNVEKYKGWTK